MSTFVVVAILVFVVPERKEVAVSAKKKHWSALRNAFIVSKNRKLS